MPQICLPWLPADPAQRFFVDLKHPEGLQLIERTGLGAGEESEEAGGGETPEKKQQHLGRGEQPFRQRERGILAAASVICNSGQIKTVPDQRGSFINHP